MGKIFAYTGSASCCEALLGGLGTLGGELTGIAVKNGEKIERLNPGSNEAYPVVTTGIALCAEAIRNKPSCTKPVPALDETLAVAFDGYIENFDALRARVNLKELITSDGDLLLSVIKSVTAESRLELMKKLAPALIGDPTYAFMSADEEAIYCAAGKAPLAVGIAESGIYLSSKLSALPAEVKRYFYIENGEYARVTADRAVIYDNKLKKIKKTYLPFDFETNCAEGLFSTPELKTVVAVKDALSRYTCDGGIGKEFIKAVAKCTQRIKRIVLTGSASTLSAARIAAYNIELADDMPAVAASPEELLHSGVQLDKSTLFVAVSSDCEDGDIISCVKKASAFGAKTLAVTKSSQGYLARCCDSYLTAQMSKRCEFALSYLLLSLLIAYISYKNDIISDVQLKVTVRLSQMLTGKAAYSLKAGNGISDAADALLSNNTVYTAGFGADAFIADEAARSFRALLGAQAFSFSSGKLAEESAKLLKGRNVFAFITSRELLQISLKHLRRLRAKGAAVTIIASSDAAAEINDFESVIELPENIALFAPVIAGTGIQSLCSAAEYIIENEKEQRAV